MKKFPKKSKKNTLLSSFLQNSDKKILNLKNIKSYEQL